MEFFAAGSLGLHSSRPYHLTPFLSLLADELRELFGWSRRENSRAHFGEAGRNRIIGDRRVDLRIERLDDLHRRASRTTNSGPEGRLKTG
jgi:hypothetical protein